MTQVTMAILVYSGSDPARIAALLDRHAEGGFTVLHGAHGRGATGPRLGNRVWPGENTVFFSFLNAAAGEQLAEAIRQVRDQLPDGDRVHLAVLPAALVV